MASLPIARAELVSLDADLPTLVLTGNRHKRQYEFKAFGKRVLTPPNGYSSLLLLVHARYATKTGYTRILQLSDSNENVRQIVSRLRKDIDKALGLGNGKALIETGDGTEYRLAMLQDEIAVDDTFEDLPCGIVSPDQFEFLKCHIAVTSSSHPRNSHRDKICVLMASRDNEGPISD